MSYPSNRPQPESPPFGAATYAPPPWSGLTAWDPGLLFRELVTCRPLRIAMIVLAFVWWWPVGLATLFVMMWSRRAGCGNYGPRGFRQDSHPQEAGSPSHFPQWGNWGRNAGRAPAGSGNRAFDDYRTETLRRLEEEQSDFVGFLDRLRYAKDKAEFDQFLAERRQRPENPPEGNVPDRSEPANPA